MPPRLCSRTTNPQTFLHPYPFQTCALSLCVAALVRSLPRPVRRLQVAAYTHASKGNALSPPVGSSFHKPVHAVRRSRGTSSISHYSCRCRMMHVCTGNSSRARNRVCKYRAGTQVQSWYGGGSCNYNACITQELWIGTCNPPTPTIAPRHTSPPRLTAEPSTQKLRACRALTTNHKPGPRSMHASAGCLCLSASVWPRCARLHDGHTNCEAFTATPSARESHAHARLNSLDRECAGVITVAGV